MRFRIRGVDISTSLPLELFLEADDEVGARRRCHELGVREETIGPAASASPQEPVLVRLEPGYVQTIEQTGKPWKALLLVSLGLLTLGVASCSWAVVRDPRALTHPPLLSVTGATLAIVGLAGVISARLGAWWKHG